MSDKLISEFQSSVIKAMYIYAPTLEVKGIYTNISIVIATNGIREIKIHGLIFPLLK